MINFGNGSTTIEEEAEEFINTADSIIEVKMPKKNFEYTFANTSNRLMKQRLSLVS